MKKDATSFVTNMKNNIWAIKKIWYAAPSRVIFAALLHIVDKLWDVYMSIFFIRYLVDGILANRKIGYLLILILISALLFLLRRFMFSYYKYNIQAQSDQKIYSVFNDIIYQKATDVDLAAFEDREFYDNYTKACLAINTHPVNILDNLMNFVTLLLATFTMIVSLIQIDAVALVFVIFPLFSYFICGKRIKK